MSKYDSARELTFNKAAYGLQSGGIDKQDFLKDYARLRKQMLANIRAIRNSDVNFSRNESIPRVPTAKELSKNWSIEKAAHAIADINKFRKERGTVSLRRENVDKSIKTLNRRFDLGLNRSNYNVFADFMSWFHEMGLNRLFASDDERVEDFLAERLNKKQPASKRSWGRVFTRWLKENGFEEEAETVAQQIFPGARR